MKTSPPPFKKDTILGSILGIVFGLFVLILGFFVGLVNFIEATFLKIVIIIVICLGLFVVGYVLFQKTFDKPTGNSYIQTRQ